MDLYTYSYAIVFIKKYLLQKLNFMEPLSILSHKHHQNETEPARMFIPIPTLVSHKWLGNVKWLYTENSDTQETDLVNAPSRLHDRKIMNYLPTCEVFLANYHCKYSY